MADTDGRSRKGLSLVGPEADVGFYSARASGAGPVLVLGCANGRVAAAVAAKGVRVLGVDPSARMIESAEERRVEDPAVFSSLRLLVCDLRMLRLDERFPLVLAPQNAISLMTSYADLVAFLSTVVHHLEPNGTLLFDAPAAPKAGGSDPLREEMAYAPPDPTRPVFSPHLQHRTTTRKGEPAGKGIHRLRIRQFSLLEMDDALEEAGLVAHERYGDYSGRPFDSGDPLQVVVAARKEAEL
ncbi:MAG: methyltransferase domain-containing protein [Myxococcaceae bacterium]